MAAADEIKALVARMPDPDKNGTYVNLDPDLIARADQAVAELHKAGPQAVLALVDLLREPGDPDDLKPHLALHLLAVRVTAPADDKARADFALALASRLGGDRPKVIQEFLIQELALAGGKEVVETLGKMLLDPDLCDPAARALASIRDGAAPQLLAALPKVQGRGRLSLVKKLAILRAPAAAGAFKQALAGDDPDLRIAGAWGIARIADASAADALLKAADARQGWERLNLSDACMTLADALRAAGKKPQAVAVYAHLAKTRTEPAERHLRDAAQAALDAAN